MSENQRAANYVVKNLKRAKNTQIHALYIKNKVGVLKIKKKHILKALTHLTSTKNRLK